MREIKFRAWNDAEKKMVHSNHCIEFDGSVHHYKDGCVLLTELIPMQYTGLKDKNGNEIYEGDVIAISKTKQPWMIVRWHKAYFATEHIGQKDSWLLLPDQEHAGRSWEVIGNVHDNPELLTNPL